MIVSYKNTKILHLLSLLLPETFSQREYQSAHNPLETGQIIQDVFKTQAQLLVVWTAAARRAEALKPQKMAVTQALWRPQGLKEVGLACPEKYTTECIEGVSATA
jgi:hypothetical protein